jgi:hypothetical protein
VKLGCERKRQAPVLITGAFFVNEGSRGKGAVWREALRVPGLWVLRPLAFQEARVIIIKKFDQGCNNADTLGL